MKYQAENGRQPEVPPNKMRLRSLAGVEVDAPRGKNEGSAAVHGVYLGPRHASSGVTCSSCCSGPSSARKWCKHKMKIDTQEWVTRQLVLPNSSLVFGLGVTPGAPPRWVFCVLPCGWNGPFLLPGRAPSACALRGLRREVGEKWEFPCPPEAHLLSSSSIASDPPLSLSPSER